MERFCFHPIPLPILNSSHYTGSVQGGESIHVQWRPPGADGLSPQCCRQLPGGRGQVQATTTDQVVHTKGECVPSHIYSACTHCIGQCQYCVTSAVCVYACKCTFVCRVKAFLGDEGSIF